MDHIVKKFLECSAATTGYSARPHLFPYFPRGSLPHEIGPNEATVDFPLEIASCVGLSCKLMILHSRIDSTE